MENIPNDPVEMYLREAASVQPLSKEEEASLLRQLGQSRVWNEEQEKAARRLIESQLLSVVRVAERHSSSGIPTLDLIEQGNFGLLNAVRSFAQAPTGDFAAYATTSIQDAIQHNRLITRRRRVG